MHLGAYHIGILSLLTTLTSALVIPRTTTATPYSCGCSARKCQLEGEGANVQDMAIAFMETGQALSATSYPYGDSKTGDSANFGLFKNNWFMIRTSCSQFAGQSASSWQNGAALNSNDAAAIKCLHQQMAKYGSSFFGGQRDGQTGISNPNTADIKQYSDGVTAVENYLKQGHLTDNQAAYVVVPAI